MKMEMMEAVRTVTPILEILSTLFIFVIGLVALVVIDNNQSKKCNFTKLSSCWAFSFYFLKFR